MNGGISYPSLHFWSRTLFQSLVPLPDCFIPICRSAESATLHVLALNFTRLDNHRIPAAQARSKVGDNFPAMRFSLLLCHTAFLFCALIHALTPSMGSSFGFTVRSTPWKQNRTWVFLASASRTARREQSPMESPDRTGISRWVGFFGVSLVIGRPTGSLVFIGASRWVMGRGGRLFDVEALLVLTALRATSISTHDFVPLRSRVRLVIQFVLRAAPSAFTSRARPNVSSLTHTPSFPLLEATLNPISKISHRSWVASSM